MRIRNFYIVLFSALLSLQFTFANSEPEGIHWSDSVVETDEEGASVLIIPMKGQMHTDINREIFEDQLDAIEALNPDLILVEMNSRDWRNTFHQGMGWGDREEFSGYSEEDLIGITQVFHVKLKKIPQAIWVKDASGTSTILSLSWPSMYMSEGSSLHATTGVARNWMSIKNVDTHGKIREAYAAHCKVLAFYGKRSTALVRAFIDPEVALSGTWNGKEVDWKNDLTGDMPISGVGDMPHLSATMATEVGISKGNVVTRNDVLLAEGIREYHLVGEDITSQIANYTLNWREDYDQACKLWLDAKQFETWAIGKNTARYLREYLKTVKRVLRMIKESTAVAMRIQQKHGITVSNLEQLIEQIEERIKALRDGNDSGGRGGGSGGRPIGGGGGGA